MYVRSLCARPRPPLDRKVVILAAQLYIEGLTEFLDVLNAQRSLYSSKDALTQSARTMFIEWIALYQALGGGSEEMQTADEIGEG